MSVFQTTINMRAAFLLATLLCALCVTQVRTQDNTNTLRLCGRAFIRAVVFNCGGSRWRRTMGEEDTWSRSEYRAFSNCVYDKSSPKSCDRLVNTVLISWQVSENQNWAQGWWSVTGETKTRHWYQCAVKKAAIGVTCPCSAEMNITRETKSPMLFLCWINKKMKKEKATALRHKSFF